MLVYKKGWYGRFRGLDIFTSENVYLACIKQGEQMEIEIPEDIEFIYGKVDWGETKKLKTHDLMDCKYIEIVPFFTLDPFKNIGLTNLPIEFIIKRKGV